MLVESRIQGPVGGTGEPLLTMKYVATDDKVNVGEKVVTSGMDKIFPRDIPVGTVQEVKPGTPFKQIWLRPAAKLERLEEVIVLLTQEPVAFSKESQPSAMPANSPSTATNPANAGSPAAPTANREKP
jgi:cell shape-determining protein MreC